MATGSGNLKFPHHQKSLQVPVEDPATLGPDSKVGGNEKVSMIWAVQQHSEILPPVIMIQWKNGCLRNNRLLYSRIIFHFHEYGKKLLQRSSKMYNGSILSI